MRHRHACRCLSRTVAFLIVLAVTAAPLAASAHTDLVSSDPASGARLDRLPASVELSFSGPVDPGLSTVILTAPDGGNTGTKLTTSQGASSSVLRAGVSSGPSNAAPAGTWTIDFRVTSTDGHPIQGTVKFKLTRATPDGRTPGDRVQNGPKPEPRAAPSIAATKQTGTGAPWLYPALAVAITLVSAVAIAGRFKSRGDSSAEGPQDNVG